MRALLETIVICMLIEKCASITRLSTTRPYITNGWHTAHEITRQQEKYRSSRNTEEYPHPQLPWEEALRHSVYLTLIRDRINSLITKNDVHDDKIKTQDEIDINLWNDIRRAPFKVRSKERGPIFGDIAILSRGRLVHVQGEFQFVEDENVKECIECHLYSSRTNELEAEKTLSSSCVGANCRDNVVALWTVRRIRHRNYNNEKSPYRYELMFSISSKKRDYDRLDYNIPTQTFTIKESEDTVTKNPVYFKDNYINKNNNKNEESFWIHKSVENGHKNTVVFPEFQETHSSNIPTLNLGEVYTESSNFNTRVQYSDPDYTQSKHRGSKKFEQNDRVTLESDYSLKKNTQAPTITHLHHHYYLNDEGMPILKFPHNDERMNHKYISNMFENRNVQQPTVDYKNQIETESSTNTPLNNPITIPIYIPDENDSKEFATTSENPLTLQMQLTNKLKTIKPTKPFKPSLQDFNTRYSELDPLYPPIVSTVNPIEVSTINSITIFVPELSEAPITKSYTTESILETTLKSFKINNTRTGRRKIERPTRKPFRRLKIQKKFTDLVNVQLPSPDKSAGTTLPYENTNTVTENVNESNITSKNTQSRRKYQRKPNLWLQRHLKPKIKTKTILNDNVLESNNNYNTTAKYNNTIVKYNITDDIILDNNETESNTETTTIPNYTQDVYTDFSNQTELENDTTTIDIAETTTAISIQSESTLPTSTNYNVSSEETFTPLTKKSLVTSISLKLGNKTRPYYHHPPRNQSKNITESSSDDPKIINKAKVVEIKRNSSKFKIFKTDNVKTDDDITDTVLEHAEVVNSKS